MSRNTIILIVLLIVTVFLVLGLIVFRFSWFGKAPAKIGSGSVSEDVEIRLDQLEKAVAKMISQTPLISPTSSGDSVKSTPANLDARLNNIESSIASLQSSVNSLKNTTESTDTTSSTSTTKKSPVYIPLGWQGSASSTDWTSVSAQSFVFDPADYPGFTSVTFEANLQIYQGNGTAYARIYNSTDSGAVYGSDISTTSQEYKWVSSSNFNLTNAKKTYILQLRSNTAYASMVQNARLKVNF